MPGVNLVSRETIYSRGSHQMCHQEPHIQLSQEEQNAAEESLSVYCKPVELYNILQRRAIKNPLFLQRSLHYKIQAKNKRRIQISVSISGSINDGMSTQSLFPIYILLARPISTTNVETQRSTVYRFSEACKLTAFSGAETVSSAQARFILPEISKLSAEIKSGSLAMLLVSCADITNHQGIDLNKNNMFSDLSNFGGYCLLGKIPMDLLHLDRSPNLSLGGRAEMMSSVSMRSCYMKLSGLDEAKCVSFHFPHNSEAVSILQQVPVIISAEELGAKDISAYDLYSFSDIPENSLSHIMRLRAGNVTFNYKYYNDMLQRTEVTEDFTCPFCLVRCASYKGLRCHLTSSHDLFRYEFWVNGDYQVVSVSVKTDLCNSEIAADVDPRKQTFSFCHKPIRRWKPKIRNQNTSHVHSLLLDSDVPEGAKCDNSSPNTTCISSATGVSFAEPDSIQSVPGSNLAPPPMLQFAKTRKLSAERSDPRSRALLKKRQFFHSHRAQPMAVEQVFAEQDSEDEVDDDVADLEDRRTLDDFVDVTNDEKQMMHLWNSFIRKQRVLADTHTSWACEAFSKLHQQDFVQNPQLLWCWRLFMIKLWNHGLLDEKTMNNCNVILDQYIHPTATTQS